MDKLWTEQGMHGLRVLAYMAIIFFIGSGIAGCFGLASLVCGVACARHRKCVLFWTIPLWLAAGYGLIAGVISLVLFINSRKPFICAGKCDDVVGVLAVWLGTATILSLASWLLGGVYRKRLKYFPWWSVPLWTTVVLGLLILFG